MLQHFEITEPRAAAAFAAAPTRGILFALMKRDLSLSDLRSLSGMSLSLLHYHIKRLQNLGLVRETVAEPRAGRPIKFYRAVAHQFHVPGSVDASTGGAG